MRCFASYLELLSDVALLCEGPWPTRSLASEVILLSSLASEVLCLLPGGAGRGSLAYEFACLCGAMSATWRCVGRVTWVPCIRLRLLLRCYVCYLKLLREGTSPTSSLACEVLCLLLGAAVRGSLAYDFACLCGAMSATWSCCERGPTSSLACDVLCLLLGAAVRGSLAYECACF